MKAHSSQQRPTQAHEGQCRPTKTKKGPNDASTVWRRLGHRYIFLKCTIYLQKLTKAHSSQRRPTKTKKGPNNARRVVWAIGTCFFKMYFLFFIFYLLLRAPAPHLWPRQS